MSRLQRAGMSAGVGGTPRDHFDASIPVTKYHTGPGRSELSDRKRDLYTALLIVGIAGAGAWTILYATHPGIGLYSDSAVYLRLARRLLAGHGYTILDFDGNAEPVPWFPFLYPTLLALPGLFRGDLLAGARWMGAILFFANVLLMGAISYRRCGNSIGAAAQAAFLACASYDMISYHTIALSDATSLLFVLLAFMFMGNYLEKPSPGSFVGAAAATALAFGTRYAAAAFVLAGFAAILLWEKRAFAKRLLDAVLFGLGSSSLMILWMLRNMRYGQGATGRHLGFHPVLDMDMVKETLLGISTWASNGHIKGADVYVRASIVAAVILVVLAAAARASFRKPGTDLRSALPLLYILSYIVVWLLTLTFLQAEVYIGSGRHFLPIHALMIILVVNQGNRLYQRLEAGVPKTAASVFCVAISLCFLVWVTQWARRTHEHGQGYASSTYTHSKMLATIRGLPKDARFYSNLPWPIGIYTDRLCDLLPIKIVETTFRENTEYRDQMEDFAETMRENDVYFAYFKEGDPWFAFPSIKDMQSFVPLRAVAETEDGIIFAAAGR